MAEITVTLKGGPKYDDPWIVIKADSLDELQHLIYGVRSQYIDALVAREAKAFQDVYGRKDEWDGSSAR